VGGHVEGGSYSNPPASVTKDEEAGEDQKLNHCIRLSHGGQGKGARNSVIYKVVPHCVGF